MKNKLSELTEREAHVMGMLVKGMTAKEIANEIFVSKRTVDFHTTNILRKLGVKSKIKLIATFGGSI